MYIDSCACWPQTRCIPPRPHLSPFPIYTSKLYIFIIAPPTPALFFWLVKWFFIGWIDVVSCDMYSFLFLILCLTMFDSEIVSSLFGQCNYFWCVFVLKCPSRRNTLGKHKVSLELCNKVVRGKRIMRNHVKKTKRSETTNLLKLSKICHQVHM